MITVIGMGGGALVNYNSLTKKSSLVEGNNPILLVLAVQQAENSDTEKSLTVCDAMRFVVLAEHF